ncbi:MAG: DpnD/PcfM family protein [Bacillota bacterium]
MPKNQERRFCPYENLLGRNEIQAENAQQAEEMIREAYSNQEYILDAENFTGVDFITTEKEMDAQSRNQRHHGQER